MPNSLIYFLSAILAFCSIVYELLLGQTLAAFLGDTVYRYCTTIGLYLFALGFGAYRAEGGAERNPLAKLVQIELLLVIFGACSVPGLYFLSWLIGSGLTFSLLAYSFIFLIGYLSGYELPLLIYIWKKNNQGAGVNILGLNYFGAFLGTVAFSFWFYPFSGLTLTALYTSSMNLLCLMILLLFARGCFEKRSNSFAYASLSFVALIALVLAYMRIESLNEFLTRMFIA